MRVQKSLPDLFLLLVFLPATGGCGAGAPSGNPELEADDTASTDLSSDDPHDLTEATSATDAEAANDETTAATQQISGAVQKGPFLVGSSVQLVRLDENLNPTGEVYATETRNDLGEFSIQAMLQGPGALSANGFYWNEITDALSSAPLTLRALVPPAVVPDQAPIYINVLTHLIKARVEALVANRNASFDEALSLAEEELVAALAITPPDFRPARPAIAASLAGDDDDTNAYLLAVSCTLIEVAISRGPTAVDANFQAILNTIADQLRDSGTIDSNLKSEILIAMRNIDTGRVRENLSQRLRDLGISSEPPNIDRILDQDGDGRVNTDDLCPQIAELEDVDLDADKIGDACDHCPSTACGTGEVCVPSEASGLDDVCAVECRDSVSCGPGHQCQGVQWGPSSDSLTWVGICVCIPFLDSPCGSSGVCVARGDLPGLTLVPFSCVSQESAAAAPSIGEPCAALPDVICGAQGLCEPDTGLCGRVCRHTRDYEVSDCGDSEYCHYHLNAAYYSNYGTCASCSIRIAVQEEPPYTPGQPLHLSAPYEFEADSGNRSVLGYNWTLTAPSGSVAVFAPDRRDPAPSFVPDVGGDYTITVELSYNNSKKPCTTATLQVVVGP